MASLSMTRKQLVVTSNYLERLMDEAFQKPKDKFDKDEFKEIQSASDKTQKAIQTVLELQAKLRAQQASDEGAAINLDEARAEIKNRLARLAA
ncbi:MAG: hypothetical protein AAGH74_01470 [Pseudomonadota bacterium]